MSGLSRVTGLSVGRDGAHVRAISLKSSSFNEQRDYPEARNLRRTSELVY